LFLEVLCHELEHLGVSLACLCVPNPADDSEGVYEFIEREAVVRGWLGHAEVIAPAARLRSLGHHVVIRPKLLVLQHDFLEIFKSDDYRVDFTKFA